jgi:hypothetical protein
VDKPIVELTEITDVLLKKGHTVFMNKLFAVLLSSLAISLLGCQTTPREKVTTVTRTSTTTVTKPMTGGAVSLNPTDGTATFVIPADTTYTIEWYINSDWYQRIAITSSIAGVLEKHDTEPYVKTLMWRHQYKTGAVPETLTILMHHRDDSKNWFPSALQTKDLPTDDTVRFSVNAEDHPKSPGPLNRDDSQLVFEW